MRHKIALIISIVVVVGFITAFGWWYMTYVRQSGSPEEESVEIPEWYHTDKDGDGITDDEEVTLGTSGVETDSDGDSIPDNIEIESYKTDPTNSDTDGDGFPDGFELLQGYNPLEKAPTNQ